MYEISFFFSHQASLRDVLCIRNGIERVLSHTSRNWNEYQRYTPHQ